jgi:hypothetical protein
MAYIGRQQDGFGVRSRFIYTATGGQTTFDTDDSSNALSYSDGAYVDVYLNGVLLDPSDYTATSLTSIVLDAGAAADDVLEVIVYDVFSVFSGTFTNGITASEATITNGISAGSATVTGDLTVDTNTLYVDASRNNVGIGGQGASGRTVHVQGTGFTEVLVEKTDSTTSAMILGADSGVGSLVSRVSESDNTAVPMRFLTGSNERMRIDSSGNVDLYQGNNLTWRYAAGSTIRGSMSIDSADNITFSNGSSNTERMRIDGSGNLLVGRTSVGGTGNGHSIRGGDSAIFSRDASGETVQIGRNASNGQLVRFNSNGTSVGSIENNSTNLKVNSSAALELSAYNSTRLYVNGGGLRPWADNTYGLGATGERFTDVWAVDGSINTSDGDEKQQISNLTEAEITAAKAISKLFKKFKWNSAVDKKGTNARTHTGVIAQEVRAALEAEGLDARNYAFFISGTWWETQTEVPAVAEETDEEGNVIVEAQEAYTRTDTYDTAEEAPEGATERTRLGIRYHELLAFIGAATEQRLTHLETLEARIESLENA